MSKNGQNFSKNREIVQSLKYVYGPILKFFWSSSIELKSVETLQNMPFIGSSESTVFVISRESSGARARVEASVQPG